LSRRFENDDCSKVLFDYFLNRPEFWRHVEAGQLQTKFNATLEEENLLRVRHSRS